MTDEVSIDPADPSAGRPRPGDQPGWSSFLLGAAAGGVAGIAAALLLSGPVRALAGALARRLGRGDREGLRFELLLQ